MALFPPPPPRVLLLVLCSTIGTHICRFFGYVVSTQARSCNEMGTFFNNTTILLKNKRNKINK